MLLDHLERTCSRQAVVSRFEVVQHDSIKDVPHVRIYVQSLVVDKKSSKKSIRWNVILPSQRLPCFPRRRLAESHLTRIELRPFSLKNVGAILAVLFERGLGLERAGAGRTFVRRHGGGGRVDLISLTQQHAGAAKLLPTWSARNYRRP